MLLRTSDAACQVMGSICHAMLKMVADIFRWQAAGTIRFVYAANAEPLS